MRVLECSTKGDKRFSAFGAKVNIFNVEDTIEFHYQLSKRVDGIKPIPQNASWKEKMDYLRKVKGKTPTYIVVAGIDLPTEYLTAWYKLLWYVYLDSNPDLVDYLRQFDEYSDIFKGKSVNSQADVIRQYIKVSPESVLAECRDLIVKIHGSTPSPDNIK